ncbi:hypothetical protein L9G15_04895 [Shewanella sp. A3A]|nr:hypothetical protein [Shewanella ferrihydritica]
MPKQLLPALLIKLQFAITQFHSLITTFVLAVVLITPTASASEASVTAHQVFEGKLFMALVLMQEQNGESGFKLEFDDPGAATGESTMLLGDYQATANEFALKNGIQTLRYRITAKNNDETRTFYVLYSGIVSLLAETNKHYFFIAEEYQNTIRYYAMFDAAPSLADLSHIIKDALVKPDSALIATRWSGKESEVLIFSDKLTQ